MHTSDYMVGKMVPTERGHATCRLPNLIIIGAQKCGTTSLHYYLGLHPRICMSREKELDFFIRERNWCKGFDWYKSQFSHKPALVFGEASPNYTCYPTYLDVPYRMHSLVPDAKLIYLVRDPIERIISHYIHNTAAGTENRALGDALRLFDNNPYVCRSQYYVQLSLYLEYYPPSQILVLTQEELRDQRLRALRRVFQFLGVDERFFSLGFLQTRHRTKDKRRRSRLGMELAELPVLKAIGRLPPSIAWHVEQLIYWRFSSKIEPVNLDPDLRKRLIAYLQGDTNRLRRYLGATLDNWSV